MFEPLRWSVERSANGELFYRLLLPNCLCGTIWKLNNHWAFQILSSNQKDRVVNRVPEIMSTTRDGAMQVVETILLQSGLINGPPERPDADDIVPTTKVEKPAKQFNPWGLLQLDD
jgi:hypothetical protein